jgi:hypothetical protein
MPLPAFTSLKEWEQRRAFLRKQILVSAGLSPMPPKTPLHPQIFGKIEGAGYTIEKVLLETMPGFYLGGNLYRPRNGKPKHPGVLNPHGHWQNGRLESSPIDSGPAFGISLARQGYVVFAYDMVGYTDTMQVPHRFGSAAQRLWSFGPLGLQLWDSIRALDFMASLDDVDASRLGIAGASGGATQSLLLAAIDDRVQFESPVNMVSAMMQGDDLCENAPGLRLHTSNVEMAAMFAQAHAAGLRHERLDTQHAARGVSRHQADLRSVWQGRPGEHGADCSGEQLQPTEPGGGLQVFRTGQSGAQRE